MHNYFLIWSILSCIFIHYCYVTHHELYNLHFQLTKLKTLYVSHWKYLYWKSGTPGKVSVIDEMVWRWPNNNNTIFFKADSDQQCDNNNNLNQNLPINMTTTIYLFKYAQQCNHINIFSLNSPNNLISNSTKYIQKAGSDASGLINIKYGTVY